MRKEHLTLPILISFNELAWIAVFTLMLMYTMGATRSKKEIAALTVQRDAVVHQKEEALRQREEVLRKDQQLQNDLNQKEELLKEAQRRLRYVVTDDKSLNQKLVGLHGNLRRVVFVIDRSGSMKKGYRLNDDNGPGRNESRWEYTRNTIQTWLECLPIEEAALITFSDTADIYPADGSFLSMPNARESLLQQLHTISPGGNTNTLMALQRAFAYPQVDTIIIFTDGFPDRDGSNRFDIQMAESIYKLCREPEHANTPVNVIGLGDYFNAQQGNFLNNLARLTGGTFIGR